jgi:xanthine dehydrogenase YagR molybdenum-binding subunit
MKVVLNAAVSGPNPVIPNVTIENLEFRLGKIVHKGNLSDPGIGYTEVLNRAHFRSASGGGRSNGTAGSKELAQFSLHSFGAQFCEVTWQPETARLRVKRFLSVIDGGRILNPIPGRNQIEGAVVMGVGMALFEETNYDSRYGAPLNSNLADYMITTNADSPQIDVVFVDHPDTILNEMGVRGIGEIGLAGTAAAITAAVYHATGVRVRELPIRIEDLLMA